MRLPRAIPFRRLPDARQAGTLCFSPISDTRTRRIASMRTHFEGLGKAWLTLFKEPQRELPNLVVLTLDKGGTREAWRQNDEGLETQKVLERSGIQGPYLNMIKINLQQASSQQQSKWRKTGSIPTKIRD